MWKQILLVIAISPWHAYCQQIPETDPRPSIDGFTAMRYICNQNAGAIPGQTFSGRQGTLKECADRCANLPLCKGFNFVTDQNQCSFFSTDPCTSNQQGNVFNGVNQNFYQKLPGNCKLPTSGREYVVAFLANRVTQPKNSPLRIWLEQSENPGGAVVTIELDPSITDDIPKLVNIPYGQAVAIDIPHTMKITDSDQGVNIESKAIRLSSPDSFTLFGVNKEYFTADAFMGIPIKLLGKRYHAACHWPPFYNCEFAVAATRDGTTIRITLPATPTSNVGTSNGITGTVSCSLPFNGRTYRNGESFTVNLDKFQVVQVQDLCDLTGATIEANQDVGVWSGDSRANVGVSASRDHLEEQLFPVEYWGTDCAAWPTPNRQAGLVDYWLITADEDGTTVRVDSSEGAAVTKIFNLNAGGSVRFTANSVSEWMYFTSAKKFQAVQFAHSQSDTRFPGDPSMIVCIPSNDFAFKYNFLTPTNSLNQPYQSYLTVVTTAGTQNGLRLDGQPLDTVTWNKIPNSNLVGGFVSLPAKISGKFLIEHQTKGTKFGAYVYGATDRESYGYPAGACMPQAKTCTTRTTMVVADAVDNDCDGHVDEEVCGDKIDNDLDGEVDEDCYRNFAASAPVVAPAPRAPPPPPPPAVASAPMARKEPVTVWTIGTLPPIKGPNRMAVTKPAPKPSPPPCPNAAQMLAQATKPLVQKPQRPPVRKVCLPYWISPNPC